MLIGQACKKQHQLPSSHRSGDFCVWIANLGFRLQHARPPDCGYTTISTHVRQPSREEHGSLSRSATELGTTSNLLRISLSPRSFERGAYGHLSEGKTMKPPEKSCPLLRVLIPWYALALDKVMCWLSGPNRSYNWSVSDLSDLLDFC